LEGDQRTNEARRIFVTAPADGLQALAAALLVGLVERLDQRAQEFAIQLVA